MDRQSFRREVEQLCPASVFGRKALFISHWHKRHDTRGAQ